MGGIERYDHCFHGSAAIERMSRHATHDGTPNPMFHFSPAVRNGSMKQFRRAIDRWRNFYRSPECDRPSLTFVSTGATCAVARDRDCGRFRMRLHPTLIGRRTCPVTPRIRFACMRDDVEPMPMKRRQDPRIPEVRAPAGSSRIPPRHCVRGRRMAHEVRMRALAALPSSAIGLCRFSSPIRWCAATQEKRPGFPRGVMVWIAVLPISPARGSDRKR